MPFKLGFQLCFLAELKEWICPPLLCKPVWCIFQRLLINRSCPAWTGGMTLKVCPIWQGWLLFIGLQWSFVEVRRCICAFRVIQIPKMLKKVNLPHLKLPHFSSWWMLLWKSLLKFFCSRCESRMCEVETCCVLFAVEHLFFFSSSSFFALECPLVARLGRPSL